MKITRYISRILIGLVFIFSGTVKAIDPLGSAYKFHDYFQAFNLGFLDKLSLPLAVILCTAEFIAGFAVLTGLRQRNGLWLVMLMMSIFTPLTFVLALTNPVSDCGCFGDAVHLTNWQTFGKNIILLAAAILLLSGIKQIKQGFKTSTEWAAIASAGILFILFNVYNLRYLPVIDFLPYKTGVKIAEKMIIPEDAPADIYETTFIYEKEGTRKEFTINNYPSSDTAWKFIDQKSVLVKKGYEPPIHGFSIVINNKDITEDVLSNEGLTMLMISRKLGDADPEKLKEGFEFRKRLGSEGIDFYVLTSSGAEEIQTYSPAIKICQTDETALKTMIRSNPGYILISNGTILGKWSWANRPDITDILKFKK